MGKKHDRKEKKKGSSKERTRRGKMVAVVGVSDSDGEGSGRKAAAAAAAGKLLKYVARGDGRKLARLLGKRRHGGGVDVNAAALQGGRTVLHMVRGERERECV